MPMIEEKTDNIRGLILNIVLDQKELDLNALNTIQSDLPDFIVPFTYRTVNSETEFTYDLNGLIKMKYLEGEKSKDEYLNIWSSLINPIAECADWFMDPFSFLFDVEYIYFDRKLNKIKYIYIPAVNPCSDDNKLKSALYKIEKTQKTDREISYEILCAIQEFNIINFKTVINNLKYADPDNNGKFSGPGRNDESLQAFYADSEKPEKNRGGNDADEIKINYQRKNSKKKKEPLAGKPEKAEKKGLFNKFRQKDKNIEKNIEIIGGAVENSLLFEKDFASDGFQMDEMDEIDEITDIAKPEILTEKTFLKLVGSARFPEMIKLDFSEKKTFTIGRFNKIVGVQQSDFEFGAGMKGISRKHAVIENTGDGYILIDKSNSGTFINGTRINFGTPVKIKSADKISFGSVGADYIFNV